MTSDELAALYDAHAPAVFGFLMVLTGSDADARDVMQDVFVRLANSTTSLSEVNEPRAFLLTMARRSVIDRTRRASTRVHYHHAAAAEAPGVFEAMASPDDGLCREALEQALMALPEEQRSVVVMHLWAGLTFRQIASALEISQNTAASRFRYGVIKLREILQPLYDEIR
jgi:RNA polymerase sigma-70 factor, ECF subfamily